MQPLTLSKGPAVQTGIPGTCTVSLLLSQGSATGNLVPTNLRPFFFFAVNSKTQEMKISVRAPIKLSTDNAFCECNISCVIAVLRPIMCFRELCHSTLLLPQYIVNSLLSIEQSLLHICETLSLGTFLPTEMPSYLLKWQRFSYFCLHLTAYLGKLVLFSMRPNNIQQNLCSAMTAESISLIGGFHKVPFEV